MERVRLRDDVQSPDYAARRVIIHAFLYYVMDAPLISDGEYDRLSQYVAKNFDALDPDRQWALGSAEEIRSSGYHIKFSSASVGAALNFHKYATGQNLREYPEDVWQVRRNGTRYVTVATSPRPQRRG
jgi:NAD-dependent DNA ligase